MQMKSAPLQTKSKRKAVGPQPSQSTKGEMRCGAEAGSYLRLIDLCVTQLKVQGPSRTCNEGKEEEKKQVNTSRALFPRTPRTA